jgi:hypothetical protein
MASTPSGGLSLCITSQLAAPLPCSSSCAPGAPRGRGRHACTRSVRMRALGDKDPYEELFRSKVFNSELVRKEFER